MQVERAATEIMDEALTAAVLDAVAAWKAAAGGLTNVLARDLGAVHANTAPADLPREVRAAIAASVRDTFKRLQREDYVIRRASAPERAPAPPPTTVPRGARPARPDARRPGPPASKPPGAPKRPPRPR